MPNITITATEEQLKAVNAVVVDATAWVQAAFNGKASKCIERVLEKYSDKNLKKLNDDDKVKEFKTLNLKTRKELEAEGKGELNIS